MESNRLNSFGITCEIVKEQWIQMLYSETLDVAFGIVLCCHQSSLCISAKAYNRAFENTTFKRVKSLDPTGRIAGTSESDHTETCSFVRNRQDLYEYLEVSETHRDVDTEDMDKVFEPPEEVERIEIEMPNFIRSILRRAIEGVDLSSPGPIAAADEPKDIKEVVMHKKWEDMIDVESCKEPNTNDPSRFLCVACQTNEKTMLCVNCGQVPYCDACFKRMMTSPDLQKECPLCRAKFETTIKIKY